MKNLTVPIAIFLAVLTITPAVFAQGANSMTPAAGTSTDKSQKQAENQAARITSLKTRADKEIDRRVAALNNLITKINSNKRLSDADKSTFVSQIQSQITTLTTLRSKIDADTDLDTLRADVKSIVDSYRIFALFIPKIHILSSADSMSQAADKLTAIAAKLQTKIQSAQAAGNDVTALQSALSDMQAKVADAKTQYQNAENTVSPLTPDGYPTNKSQLDSARAMIKTGAQDLKTARADAVTIISGLKSMKKTSTSSPAPKSTQ